MKITYVYEGDVYTSDVISYNQSCFKVIFGDIKILVDINDVISVEFKNAGKEIIFD